MQEDASCSRETVPQKITVVLPAFNEEVSIGSVVLLARHHADRVIVVDDGSSDRTAEIAEKAGAEVIVHSPNSGKGVALKFCIQYMTHLDNKLELNSLNHIVQNISGAYFFEVKL